MEPGANLQQARNTALDFYITRTGSGYLGKNFQQGALTRAIPTDNSQNLALFHLEADILQSPELFSHSPRVMFVADLERRIWFASQLGPPAGKIFLEGGASNHAQAVNFAEILDRNDSGHVVPCF